MITILAATDLSREANNAAAYAANTCAEIGANLILFTRHVTSVHVVNARLSATAFQETLDLSKAKLEAQAKKLSATHNISVTPVWTTGNLYEEIQKAIQEHHVNLIAMGMADKSFDQDLLGNTTTAAISKLDIPVLAVPHNVNYKKIKKILFACDAHKGLFPTDFRVLKTVAQVLHAETKVFYVKRTAHPESNKKNLMEMLENKFSDISYIVEIRDSDAPVIREIKNEIERYKPDLLMMVPYRYGFLNSIIHKSKTRAMASGRKIPLLTVPYIEGK